MSTHLIKVICVLFKGVVLETIYSLVRLYQLVQVYVNITFQNQSEYILISTSMTLQVHQSPAPSTQTTNSWLAGTKRVT